MLPTAAFLAVTLSSVSSSATPQRIGAAGAPSGQHEWIRGFGFAGGPMAAAQTPLGSEASNHSLAALAATGATDVRLYSTWYMASPSSTAIEPKTNAASPLRSETDVELRDTLVTAAQLGLRTILSPRLDFDWDQAHMAGSAPYNMSVGKLGASFSAAQWQAWFVAYSAFAQHHAAMCAVAPRCTGLVLADELHSAFASVDEASWRALAASIRQLLPGGVSLFVMTSRPDVVSWWTAIDYIGFNAEQTPLARYTYTQAADKAVITSGIHVPWPPLPFESTPMKLGQVTWGGNVTLPQCEMACSGGVSHSSGVCTAIQWDSATKQCYLYAHVTGTKPAGNSTWRSFTQSLARGSVASCTDTVGLVRSWQNDGILETLSALHKRYNKTVVASFGYQSRPDAHRAPAGALRPGYTDCSVWMRCYDDACQASLVQAALTAFSSESFFGGALYSYWSTDPSQGGRSDSSRAVRGKAAEGVLRNWFGAESFAVPPIDVSLALPDTTNVVTSASAASSIVEATSGPAPAGARNGYVFGTGEWSAANLTLTEVKIGRAHV